MLQRKESGYNKKEEPSTLQFDFAGLCYECRFPLIVSRNKAIVYSIRV